MNTNALPSPILLFLFLQTMSVEWMPAQPAGTHYEESKVPAYTLPDPLRFASGAPVASPSQWREERRPEVLRLFQEQVYGRSPGPPQSIQFVAAYRDSNALGGRAIRKEVTVHFSEQPEGPQLRLLLYLPSQAKRPAAAFVGLNFKGNHTIHSDPGIRLTKQWQRPDRNKAPVYELPPQETRGSSASRWPVETLLERGFALVTAYYGDLEPDYADGWQHGVRSLFQVPLREASAPSGGRGQPEEAKSSNGNGAPPWAAPSDWGAIGAWAWGLSRIMDYLKTDPEIDSDHVALIGHSRLGKTALWAGAQDERFGLVISNDSGCGGAALSRRCFGETVERINRSFPHWFCGNFKKYNGNEQALPVDQHMLIALIAPRPVYVASAEQDLWADPRGEFLSAKHAEPVYHLFHREGLEVDSIPGLNQPVGKTIGYHIRTGKHDVTDYDWKQYLDFADRHFGKSSL